MKEKIETLLSSKPSTIRSSLSASTMKLILSVLIALCIVLSILFLLSWLIPSGIGNYLFVEESKNCNEVVKKISLFSFVLFLIIALILTVFKRFINALLLRNEFIDELTQELENLFHEK